MAAMQARGARGCAGPKNIKAIAVRGKQRTEWAASSESVAQQIALEAVRSTATAKYRDWHGYNLLRQPLRRAADAQFQSGTFEEAASISPES